jgi:hypothetical protein
VASFDGISYGRLILATTIWLVIRDLRRQCLSVRRAAYFGRDPLQGEECGTCKLCFFLFLHSPPRNIVLAVDLGGGIGGCSASQHPQTIPRPQKQTSSQYCCARPAKRSESARYETRRSAWMFQSPATAILSQHPRAEHQSTTSLFIKQAANGIAVELCHRLCHSCALHKLEHKSATDGPVGVSSPSGPISRSATCHPISAHQPPDPVSYRPATVQTSQSRQTQRPTSTHPPTPTPSSTPTTPPPPPPPARLTPNIRPLSRTGALTGNSPLDPLAVAGPRCTSNKENTLFLQLVVMRPPQPRPRHAGSRNQSPQ